MKSAVYEKLEMRTPSVESEVALPGSTVPIAVGGRTTPSHPTAYFQSSVSFGAAVAVANTAARIARVKYILMFVWERVRDMEGEQVPVVGVQVCWQLAAGS